MLILFWNAPFILLHGTRVYNFMNGFCHMTVAHYIILLSTGFNFLPLFAYIVNADTTNLCILVRRCKYFCFTYTNKYYLGL
jgi:hypothetical protein